MPNTQHIPVFPQPVLDAISLVGKVVTYEGFQYYVHSVEGETWFVFKSAFGDKITVDTAMTPAPHYVVPEAMLIPMGKWASSGCGIPVQVTNPRLYRGVCLSKIGV